MFPLPSVWFAARKYEKVLSRARALAAKQEFEGAADVIISTYGALDADGALPTAPPIFNLLLADLWSRLGRKREAFCACKAAIDQFDANDQIKPGKYSDEDINYLRYRCKWIFSGLSAYKDSEVFRLSEKINIRAEDLRIDLVKKELRKTFPMTAADGFALDHFMSENATGSGE